MGERAGGSVAPVEGHGVRLTPEKTALWNSPDPSARREARRAFHAQAIRMMDDDPNATAFILDADGARLGSVYEPSYLHE